MQNEVKIFEGHRVEVIEVNGQVFFNPYDVAECLDIKNVRDSIKNFNKNQVIKLTNSDVGNTDIRKLNNAGENFLTESGVYKLVFKSRKPDAERFTDWIADEVLPSIRKTGTYTLNKSQLQVSFDEVVKSVEIIANSLNANNASKLLMYDKLFSSYGITTTFLPKYENNGSREMRPATELLRQIGANISTVAFNKMLVEQGYLEIKSRKSTTAKSGMKFYKVLSKKGLQYGENLVHEKNQREAQPYYYADTFQKLYNIVTERSVLA